MGLVVVMVEALCLLSSVLSCARMWCAISESPIPNLLAKQIHARSFSVCLVSGVRSMSPCLMTSRCVWCLVSGVRSISPVS